MAVILICDWRLRKVIASQSDAKFIRYRKEAVFFGELIKDKRLKATQSLKLFLKKSN
jgi:hypothetical protein